MYEPIDLLMDKDNILMVVCGGVGVTISQLDEWKRSLG
jgi:hypothetical protein